MEILEIFEAFSEYVYELYRYLFHIRLDAINVEHALIYVDACSANEAQLYCFLKIDIYKTIGHLIFLLN